MPRPKVGERLFCESCGEEEEFRKRWLEIVDLELKGDCDENGNLVGQAEEEAESSRGESDECFFCGNCEEDVDFLTELQILECKVEHVDQDGEWCDIELEENERNPDLVKQLAAKMV
jgi:DNA-directed RNA polymerase subunit M/transcription elongation factor TFIIS